MHDAIDADSQASMNALGVLNKTLHAVAAHLQRYNTELKLMQEIWRDIVNHHRRYIQRRGNEDSPREVDDTETCNFEEISSHLKQTRAFSKELITKVQNNLALVGLWSLLIITIQCREE